MWSKGKFNSFPVSSMLCCSVKYFLISLCSANLSLSLPSLSSLLPLPVLPLFLWALVTCFGCSWLWLPWVAWGRCPDRGVSSLRFQKVLYVYVRPSSFFTDCKSRVYFWLSIEHQNADSNNLQLFRKKILSCKKYSARHLLEFGPKIQIEITVI